jgi:hypothetical protein
LPSRCGGKHRRRYRLKGPGGERESADKTVDRVAPLTRVRPMRPLNTVSQSQGQTLMRSASPAASPRARRHRVIAAEAEEANCGARRWKSAQDVHRPAASSKMPGDGALTSRPWRLRSVSGVFCPYQADREGQQWCAFRPAGVDVNRTLRIATADATFGRIAEVDQTSASGGTTVVAPTQERAKSDHFADAGQVAGKRLRGFLRLANSSSPGKLRRLLQVKSRPLRLRES